MPYCWITASLCFPTSATTNKFAPVASQFQSLFVQLTENSYAERHDSHATLNVEKHKTGAPRVGTGQGTGY